MEALVDGITSVMLIGTAFASCGFFFTGFARLFWQAWRMPDRKIALWKVVNIIPRRSYELPNMTPEANMIVRGAIFGLALILERVCFLPSPPASTVSARDKYP